MGKAVFDCQTLYIPTKVHESDMSESCTMDLCVSEKEILVPESKIYFKISKYGPESECNSD